MGRRAAGRATLQGSGGPPTGTMAQGQWSRVRGRSAVWEESSGRRTSKAGVGRSGETPAVKAGALL